MTLRLRCRSIPMYCRPAYPSTWGLLRQLTMNTSSIRAEGHAERGPTLSSFIASEASSPDPAFFVLAWQYAACDPRAISQRAEAHRMAPAYAVRVLDALTRGPASRAHDGHNSGDTTRISLT